MTWRMPDVELLHICNYWCGTMARMRRIQIVMEPELDDWLERESSARRISKSALVRQCLRESARSDVAGNGLAALLALSDACTDVEPVDDVDSFLYGPSGGEE